MLFCQLGRAHSLREICGGLACCEGQLKHLGVPVAPKKSTLAYANENRPWELYQTVFEQTLFKCQELVASQGGRQKFRFKNKLMSLDGSIIDLSVSMFDWAKFRPGPPSFPATGPTHSHALACTISPLPGLLLGA